MIIKGTSNIPTNQGGSGGSSGSGVHLYQHFVKWGGTGATGIRFNYIDDSPTSLNRDSLPTWLSTNGFDSSKPYPCCGSDSNGNLCSGFYFDGNYWQVVRSNGTTQQVTGTSWEFYNTLDLGEASVIASDNSSSNAKQLYNHLVYIHKDVDNVKLEAFVNIITDSSTPFTMSAFKTYISDALNSGGKYVASGTYWDASNGVCFIHSLKKAAGVPTFSAHKQNTTAMAGSSYSINIGSDYSILHITDTVIAL